MLSSTLYTLLKLSKTTTFPIELSDYDCVTLYEVSIYDELKNFLEGGGFSPSKNFILYFTPLAGIMANFRHKGRVQYENLRQNRWNKFKRVINPTRVPMAKLIRQCVCVVTFNVFYFNLTSNL